MCAWAIVCELSEEKTTSTIVEILLLTSKIVAELNVDHVFTLQTNLYGKMLGQNVKILTSKLSLHSAQKIST